MGINGWSHTWPSDVDILLVGPGGQKVTLASDVGTNVPINNVNLTLDAAAPTALPSISQITSGTFRPFNCCGPGTADFFPPPAPGIPYVNVDLTTLNGINPNGTWSLYVFDDETQDVGSIANGWTLTIDTTPFVQYSGSPGEASTGLAIDLNGDGVPDQLLVGDNEDETLRFYPITGGAPTAQSLQLTAVSPPALMHVNEATAEANAPGVVPNRLQMIRVNRVRNGPGSDDDWEIREADIEASARIGNTIYWLGSHSRAAFPNLNERQNRYRLFTTTLAINGGVPTLTYVNRYEILRDQLIAWDNLRPIARRYDLQTAAGLVNPEAENGFNMEGMTQTEANTLFIGFRAPLVDPYRYSDGGLPIQVHRTHAIVMEIMNPTALIAAAGSPPSTAAITVGRTYELDLGGRGI